MQNFRDLIVWKKSHALVLSLYQLTQSFPSSEMYGLTSQIRRSDASIPANIAEGCGRRSNAELAQFVQIAVGSASELEYHLLLAHDLGYLADCVYEPTQKELDATKRMMISFLKQLRA